MQYLCSQCRRPLQMGLSMCGCGQVFSRPVPEFDARSNSMFWPPVAETQPALLQWWADLSPAIKATAAGASVLVMGLIAFGSTIHHYQGLHARYAPGTSVMAASAVPVPVQAPAALTAPAMPAPMVLKAEPRYVPPTGKSLYVPPVGQRDGNETSSVPSEQAAPMDANQSSAALGTSPAAYAAAKADAEKAVYDARDYVNSLTQADYQRAPINLQTYVSRVKQDRTTMLGSPAVNSQDLAEVDADQKSIQSSEDSCNQNRGAASITIG